MKNKKLMHLSLKPVIFDLIKKGKLKQVYKPLTGYWWSRLFTSPYHKMQNVEFLQIGGYNAKSGFIKLRRGSKKTAAEMIWRIGHAGIYEVNGTKSIVVPLHRLVIDDVA